jgi:hypothetical protein
MQTPEESIGTLNGLHYKIGLHCRAYYWDGVEWVRSDRSADDVIRAIDAKTHRVSW